MKARDIAIIVGVAGLGILAYLILSKKIEIPQISIQPQPQPQKEAEVIIENVEVL